ncbi:hypothetical protein BX600DRAFT_507214 [Xylariales sp. PMI_506]|nr:hypothetical protein BX600DRAFT_507214 [Xylariales sp. PMI_506]
MRKVGLQGLKYADFARTLEDWRAGLINIRPLRRPHVPGCRCQHRRELWELEKEACDVLQSANCTVEGCGHARKGGDKNMPFCEASHACLASECRNRRRTSPSTPTQQNFCDDHGCAERGCPNASATGSRWCDDHTCQYPTCAAFVPPREAGASMPNDRLCSVHRSCAVAGCGNGVILTRMNGGASAGDTPRRYCADHNCEYGNSSGRDPCCHEQRLAVPGSRVCEAHKCRAPGCFGEIARPGGLYCAGCQCDFARPPCLSPRRGAGGTSAGVADGVDGGAFCEAHLCREWVRGCTQAGDPQRGWHCEQHQPCEEGGGCTRPRAQEQEKVLNKCVEHMREPCRCTYGCLNRAQSDSPYCKDHICLANRACSEQRLPLSPFCRLHKCSVPICPEARELLLMLPPPVGYYDMDGDHRLPREWEREWQRQPAVVYGDDIIGSGQQQLPLHLTTAGEDYGCRYGSYCARHACRVPRCERPARRDDSAFCAMHGCGYREDNAGGDDGSDMVCGARVVDYESGRCARHRKRSGKGEGGVGGRGEERRSRRHRRAIEGRERSERVVRGSRGGRQGGGVGWQGWGADEYGSEEDDLDGYDDDDDDGYDLRW